MLRIRRYNPPMYNAAPTQIAGNGNRLNTVTSSYGKTLTLSYDASGRLAMIAIGCKKLPNWLANTM